MQSQRALSVRADGKCQCSTPGSTNEWKVRLDNELKVLNQLKKVKTINLHLFVSQDVVLNDYLFRCPKSCSRSKLFYRETDIP